MKPMPHRLASVGLALVLSLPMAGCGFTLIDQEPAPAIYDLRAPHVDKGGDPVTWQLVVEEPDALKTLGTNRIMLVRGGNEIQFYKGARWSDRGPRLIQSRLIEALENTGRIASVGNESSGINADVRLTLDLRDFEAVYEGSGAPTVKVTLSAKLLDSRSRDVSAARIFSASSEARSGRLDDIVDAFDDALGRAIVDIASWTLAKGEAE